MIDPIVDEVRRIRDEHAKKFNYDLSAICADIRQHQEQFGRRLIRVQPGGERPIKRKRGLSRQSAVV